MESRISTRVVVEAFLCVYLVTRYVDISSFRSEKVEEGVSLLGHHFRVQLELGLGWEDVEGPIGRCGVSGTVGVERCLGCAA